MRIAFDLPVVVKSRVGRASVEKTVIASVPHVVEIDEVASNDAPLALDFSQYAQARETVGYRGLRGSLWVDCGLDTEAIRRERYIVRRFEPSRSPFFGDRKGVDSRVTSPRRERRGFQS